MKHVARRVAPLVVLLAVSAAGCRRTAAVPIVAPAPPPTIQEPTDAAPEADPERERAAREAADRAARDRAEQNRIRMTLETPVWFSFDRSDLSRETRTALDAKLDLLRTHRNVKIRIEGHADDRGSADYNLALGMRRAAAARRYLVQHDIDGDRIEIVSFGEERPSCSAAIESCWQLNRRADFVVVAP